MKNRMHFELRPILSEMRSFYQQPISPARFQLYLHKLQGDTIGDIVLPISGYNPMAEDHVITKITELQEIGAEDIMSTCIEDINSKLENKKKIKIQVVLNVADDLKGGWTHRYATDYDSKFKINAFVERDYCAPYCWTSEAYTTALIAKRTVDYCYRTIHWMDHSRPLTLEDHVLQEAWVTRHSIISSPSQPISADDAVRSYYDQHCQSDDYSRIFNFLYGDLASRSLGYLEYGIDSSQTLRLIQSMALT